jgi:hypothetical protein
VDGRGRERRQVIVYAVVPGLWRIKAKSAENVARAAAGCRRLAS